MINVENVSTKKEYFEAEIKKEENEEYFKDDIKQEWRDDNTDNRWSIIEKRVF